MALLPCFLHARYYSTYSHILKHLNLKTGEGYVPHIRNTFLHSPAGSGAPALTSMAPCITVFIILCYDSLFTHRSLTVSSERAKASLLYPLLAQGQTWGQNLGHTLGKERGKEIPRLSRNEPFKK